MSIKPYLQLVRLPNIFTAAADSLAGWLLVTGSFRDPVRWLPLVAASALTYAGGIVLNDVFDYEVDRIERPKRPLPSGQIGRRFATILGVVFLALGLALVVFAGTEQGVIVELALIGAVLAYDGGLKRSPFGPEVMGACRALNLLLGMSQAVSLGGPIAWVVAVSYGVFVAGITWISRSEVHSGRRTNVAAGLTLQTLAFLGLMGACLAFGTRNAWWGVVSLLALGLAVLNRSVRAWRDPEPAMIQRAVKFGIMALVWIHVGVLLGVRGLLPALVVALFWIPAAYVGRWIYST